MEFRCPRSAIAYAVFVVAAGAVGCSQSQKQPTEVHEVRRVPGNADSAFLTVQRERQQLQDQLYELEAKIQTLEARVHRTVSMLEPADGSTPVPRTDETLALNCDFLPLMGAGDLMFAREAHWQLQLGDAGAALDSVSRIEDDFVRGHVLAGHIIRGLIEKEQFERAEAMIRKVVDPRDRVRGFSALAVAFQHFGEPERAVDALNHAATAFQAAKALQEASRTAAGLHQVPGVLRGPSAAREAPAPPSD